MSIQKNVEVNLTGNVVQETEKAVVSINSLEKGLKSLEEELKGEQVGSTRFKELQNEVKKAKSQLKDFELQVEGLDKEQRATALVDTFNGLTGAIGAVGSAFIAFGAESSVVGDVEKQLLGVANVLSGLRDASNGLVAAQKLLGNQSVKVGAALKASFKGGVTGAQALKGAIIATGIGALVVAVGLLVQYWDEFIDLLGLSASEGQKNLEIAQAQTAEAEAALEATNNSTEILKQQGMTDKEILQLKIKQTDEIIKAQEAQLEAQQTLKQEQIAAAKRNADILSGILRFLTAPLEVLLRTIDAVGSALGQDFGLGDSLNQLTSSLAGTIFSGEDEELDAGIEDTKKKLQQLKNSRAGYENQITASNKAEQEKRTAAAQKSADEQKQLEEQLAESKRKVRESSAKTQLELLETQYANEKEVLAKQRADALAAVGNDLEKQRLINERYDNEALVALNTFNASKKAITDEAEKQMEADYNELQKLRIQNMEDGMDKDLAAEELRYQMARDAAGNNYRILEELKKEHEKNVLGITEEYAEKDRQNQQMVQQAKLDLVKQGLEATIALADAFGGQNEKQQKRAFQVAKTAQLAQAVISGIEAVQNAYTTGLKSPVTAFFPAYPYIQAGLAAAFSAASIKKIQSTTFESKNAPSTPSGGGGATPSLPSIGGSSSRSLGAPQVGGNTPSTTQQGGTQQGGGTPIKTYVLAGDVTSAQQAEQKINQRRTL